MKVVYYYDQPPESYTSSIFLAGPSPRTPDVQSWRPEALRILESREYVGVVFVPEPKPLADDSRYDWGQAPRWEHKMLDMADVPLVWVPRDMRMSPGSVVKLSKDIAELPNRTEEEIVRYLTEYEPELRMPGLTTNVEFGYWATSGKAILGQPPRAPHTAYLRFIADKCHIPTSWTLEETIDKALAHIGNGALRTGGEREIPLFLWRHRAFQQWYQALKNAGNRLDGAHIEYISRVRNKPEAIFAFVIRPNIFIASENRNKINDPVIFRLDISSVILYKKRRETINSEIILVREFRSAVSNSSGFVWELPGGSSPFITDPLKVAAEETREEVGLEIDTSRLHHVGSRQMTSTLATYKSHTYSAELKEEELSWLKSQKGIPHGADYPDNPTGEKAYTEVLTLREIMERDLVDWANLGMIRSVIY